MILRALAAVMLLTVPATLFAQQVTTSTPLNSTSSSFNENLGTNFGFNIAGARGPATGNSRVVGLNPFGLANPDGAIQFRQGGLNNALAAFGGGTPANQTTGGVGIRAGNFGANLGFSLGQGSSTSSVSQTPMITSLNGHPASFSSQVQQPFVTGVTPVVNRWVTGPRNPYAVFPHRTAQIRPFQPIGQRSVGRHPNTQPPRRIARPDEDQTAQIPTFDNRLRTAGHSTAGQAALSVTEIRRRQAAIDTARNQEAQATFDRAEAAEKAGKLGVAKIYYRSAAREAVGTLKQLAEQRLRRLSAPASER